MKDIVLIGGGGHCRACIDVIEQTGQFRILGILDKAALFNTEVLGYPVIGSDDDINTYVQKNCSFIISIGQIKTATPRKHIFSLLESSKAHLATVISPLAIVSKHASIGKGTLIMHNALINAGAVVGSNCIINTGSIVEHDAEIGDHTHISTSAVINGNCRIGTEVFVGSNTVISNQISVTREVCIGAGSVVVKHIEQPGIYAGNPIRKM